ncbi:MAG: thiamine pyrophosphate-binding protein [Synechococcus sp.]
MNGAQVLVRMLEQHGVSHVFGIPGAKVDSLFIALADSPIELVVCRHEQNAAFMAQAMGRLTGRVGVCAVTSGPGVTNLVTGLATATAEGDPVLAIGGEVPLDDRFKHTHQSLDGVEVMRPVTKFSRSALTVHDLPEVFGNAVRAAEAGRPGAAFLGLPKDVGLAECPVDLSPAWGQPVLLGAAAPAAIERAAALINAARRPMVLLGLQSSQIGLAPSLQAFLQRTALPYGATFQGAGAWVAF